MTRTARQPWDYAAYPDPVDNSYTYAASGIPRILCSNGTINDNGALSGLVALAQAYPVAYVYCPASMIYTGSAAGWYYAVFSSQTACTLYNNTYTSGTPAIPASPTPFVCTAPVGNVFTQTENSLIAAHTITIPGGSLGKNGKIRSEKYLSCSNTSATKETAMYYGGTLFSDNSITTSASYRVMDQVMNKGSTNSNLGSQYFASGGGQTADFLRGTVNTAVDQVYTENIKLATGAAALNFIVLEHVLIEIIKGD